MQTDYFLPASPVVSQHTYHLTQTIDDVEYRYSAEEDRGTPRQGLYAQDGLWDDDELSSEATTIRPSSGSTFGHHSSRRQSRPGPTPPASTKSRSRSGTLTATTAKPEERSGMWTWGKKTTASEPVPLPEARSEVIIQPRGLEKKKSKSLLRGKGRRGELSVTVSPGDPDESFEAPPPLPPTPASFMTNSSPALSTASVLTPYSYPSRFDMTTPETPNPDKLDKSAKSSWRRGMKKIFKSKSSVALREAFASVDPNRPPMPEGLPSKSSHQTLGKPFSSSTPPMPSGRGARDTMWSFYSNSPLSPPPSSIGGESFGMSSHPSLPADPFASSLDLSSNKVPQSPLASPALPPKPRLSRNSPSLRDLKLFLAPAKPSLTKAKSLANIREKAAIPASAPPTKTEFSHSKTVKRVSSVVVRPNRERTSVSEEPPVRPKLLRPTLSRIPTESPPLLPPNPPYFPATTLPTRTPSSLSIDTSVSNNSNSSASINPPPSSPLPALPASAPLSPVGSNSTSAVMKRSGSSAVLLPRSRSTSMSLKAPPTSSSFFDLYEQLGIWPTPSEKDDAAEEKSPATETKESLVESPVQVDDLNAQATISQSPSATFSAGSWEAAISAFPLVDDIPAPGRLTMDFGQPVMSDQDLHIAPAPYTPFFDDEGDTSMTSNIAVEGSICSLSTYGQDSGRSGQGSSSTGRDASKSTAASGSNGYSYASLGLGPVRNSGSNGNSGPPSRDEHRRGSEGKWFDGSSGHSSQSSSDDEDDQPLSKLHPEATVVQKQAAVKRRATRKAAKARAKGRNPGGDVRWDGEGGVPADALRMKLESMLLTKEMRVYNWQLSQGQIMATSSSMRHRTQTHPAGAIRPARSFTDPSKAEASVPMVHRRHTVKRENERGDRPSVPPINTALPPVPASVTSPTAHGQIPSRHGTIRRPDAYAQPVMSGHRSSAGLSRGESTSSSSHQTSSRSHAPPPVPDVTRSNTAATSRSSTSRTRSRAMSNAASTQTPEMAAHARAVTEPIPQRKLQATSANAFIGGVNGARIALELYPETTARDVLQASFSRGELPELAPGMNWVVVESFAELGYERQIREYEPLQAVMKGWDPLSRSNCFIFRQSNNAASTWTRSIPTNAPFLGAYVQYETKKGKWSKRFLETRGGQVFVSKNDKNKEEMQINTLFHDVHVMTRQYSSPKPFVFVMKRVEPASAFENPNDYLHIFSAEESIGWKLLGAVYDAKSHAIAQTQPQLLMSAAQTVQRRPTIPKVDAPLVDLKEKKPVEKSGFTGRGLLRI